MIDFFMLRQQVQTDISGVWAGHWDGVGELLVALLPVSDIFCLLNATNMWG